MQTGFLHFIFCNRLYFPGGQLFDIEHINAITVRNFIYVTELIFKAKIYKKKKNKIIHTGLEHK